MDWLADLLRALDQEKALLICRTQRKVEAIDAALRQRLNVKQAVFHEGLTLVQRDRNAAWFAEEDGARILICSEIGSEGTEFSVRASPRHVRSAARSGIAGTTHRPPRPHRADFGNPGAMCRSSTGSSQEVLARWYHAGLNSFEKNLHGGHELLERVRRARPRSRAGLSRSGGDLPRRTGSVDCRNANCAARN